jgi:tetratricopeptide (TPR) repeat protein
MSRSKPDPVELLRAGRIREALRLMEGELAFKRRLATTWPTFRDVLAAQLVTMSGELQRLAKEPQALDAADEAVAIWTEFAAKRPSRYNPALARTLLLQAELLAGMGRHGEALAATDSAVRLYRDLAAADRGTYLPSLARALTHQSDELGYLDRIAEARAAAAEAALIRTDMLPPTRP